MKVSNIVILSLSAAFVIVGTHLTITQGVTVSYPVFMLAVALLFWYKLRQKNQPDKLQETIPDLKKRNRRKKRNSN